MGRITAFLGGDSQVGTTMTALSYGEMLAARGEKTLLICGSGKIGDPFFLNREHHSIDDLRAYLLNGHLAAADLQQVLCRDKNLWILPDVRDSITAAKYDEKTMQRICEAAGTYDHIVLDLGDRIDLGLVVSGIEAADRHYLVVTQQEKVLGRCPYLRDRVLQPLGCTPRLIINKYQNVVALLTKREISGLLQYEAAGTLPYIEFGWEMEIRHQSFREVKRYRKALEMIPEQEDSEERRHTWKRPSIWKAT